MSVPLIRIPDVASLVHGAPADAFVIDTSLRTISRLIVDGVRTAPAAARTRDHDRRTLLTRD